MKVESHKSESENPPIPKGLCLEAQGCEARAALGNARQCHNPDGVATRSHPCSGAETPSGFSPLFRWPRVAEASLPWALLRNPVGILSLFLCISLVREPVASQPLGADSSDKTNKQAQSPIYFPPPESEGGWRKLETSEDIRQKAGLDPDKLACLKQWLLDSDKRDFAAVVIRHGYIALEVERGNSAKTDSRRVASVSKAICATVLAIASEQSQQGLTPRKMKFDDPAFQFIPWAQPLSDPRKEKITVKQLFNHTSGICPEALGAPNDGTWEYILGHTGDARTAKLAFDPGTASGYSTHALHHAALVCETVTGMPYDRFAIQALFKPIGAEHWWFQYYAGGEKYGRHPSHGNSPPGLPARAAAAATASPWTRVINPDPAGNSSRGFRAWTW